MSASRAMWLHGVSLALVLTGAASAETTPSHNAPLQEDADVMTTARKAVGTSCHFSDATYGPQVAGFTEVKGVGQLTTDEGAVVIRQHGRQRVAFLAIIGKKDCRVAAVESWPARKGGEEFLDCRIDDPDPNKIPPVSHGVGLRQPGTKRLAAYIELDAKHRTLTQRGGDDPRIKCNGFESGD